MANPSDTQATNRTRELAAIMFSDIAGYTAIMGRDETEGLNARNAHRDLLRSILPRFKGRLLGDLGDGALSSFHSAIDAVNCARALQAATGTDPNFRIHVGIHVGDVLFADNTVLGDGVNVASRIQGLAPAGGICISERVYEEIRNKPEFEVQDLGPQKLKNVAHPIRVYALAAAGATFGRQTQPSTPGTRRIPSTVRWIAAAGLGTIVVAAIIYIGVMQKSAAPSPATQGASASVATAPAGPHAIRSIAVLPLDNYSGDPNQEYFADGMTDELTTDLAKISQLRVISRGSVMQFKGEHRPTTPEIAKLLNVDAVVEGSVLRVGDKVRITAQLIDAPADKHMWADSYVRDTRDVLAMQDEVALAIAKQINVELTPDQQARFANARPVNPEAYEAYLKGRYFLRTPSEDGVKKALDQFDLAIKADPNFAPAYSGVADAYIWGEDWYFPANEVMPKAKAAVEKALQLDDTLAEAHTSLGIIKYIYDLDWAGAGSEFQRAITLNPNYAFAHDQYGVFLEWLGRLDEAWAEFKRAEELDPLSPEILTGGTFAPAWQGKYDSAKELARKALDLDPNFYFAQWDLGWIDIQAGKFSEAIPELQKAQAMDSPPYVTGYLGYAYAASGDRAKAQATIAELNQMSSRRFVSPWCAAIIYLGLGDKDRALDGLDKAYDARSQMLTFLKMDKMFDPLRSEPRFIALMKKVGLDK